jgi:hypothetical protein
LKTPAHTAGFGEHDLLFSLSGHGAGFGPPCALYHLSLEGVANLGWTSQRSRICYAPRQRVGRTVVSLDPRREVTMSRNSKTTIVKPQLEQLEERSLPSFLLGGLFSATGSTTVQQNLLPPLNAMFTDMQNAKTDLQTQFTLLHAPPSPITDAQADDAFAKGAADFQRMLNDQHAISAIIVADNNFIRAAAFAELAEGGDPTDAIIVVIGPAFGLNPTKALTSVETQANNLINGSDVQTWVNTDFFGTTPSGFQTHSTWKQVTATPSF